MVERLTHIRVAAMEDPIIPTPGESVYAIRAPRMHSKKLRPVRWRDREWGFVIHTTGDGIAVKAHKKGIYPTILHADHYFESRGPQYLCGWHGFQRGDLLQIANERIQSNGVGTLEKRDRRGRLVQKGQRQSEQGRYSGSWEKDLPKSMVRRLKARFPGMTSPLGLLPKVLVVSMPAVFRWR